MKSITDRNFTVTFNGGDVIIRATLCTTISKGVEIHNPNPNIMNISSMEGYKEVLTF